jgi:hypothetical protein
VRERTLTAFPHKIVDIRVEKTLRRFDKRRAWPDGERKRILHPEPVEGFGVVYLCPDL